MNKGVRNVLLGLVVVTASACVAVVGNTTPYTNMIIGSGDRDRARAEIVVSMDKSAHAWTHGDLDGFMDSYGTGENITFVTSTGIVRGRAAIRARYAPRFAPGARHDSLSFENVEVDLLRRDAAHVLAWYRLSRGDSTVARGPTSLVMIRWDDGSWHITHDHSS